MRFCPFCARELQDSADHCVFCGKRLPPAETSPDQEAPKKKGTLVGVPALSPPPALTPSFPPSAPPPLPADLAFQHNAADRKPEQAGIRPEKPWRADGKASSSPLKNPHSTASRSEAALAPTMLGRATTPSSPSSLEEAPSLPLAAAHPDLPPPPPFFAVASPPGDPLRPSELHSIQPPRLKRPSGLPPPIPDLDLAPTAMGPAISESEPWDIPSANGREDTAAAASSLAFLGQERVYDSLASDAMEKLSPMPTASRGGFFSNLSYFLAVTDARLKRSGVIRMFRRETKAESHKLDEVLRDLGKLARTLELDFAPLNASMEVLHARENERAAAETAKAELAKQTAEEEEKFARIEADCSERINEAQDQIPSAQMPLREQREQMRALSASLAQQDKSLKTLIAERDKKRILATKTRDPDQRQDTEQAAAELALQIGDSEKERENTAQEINERAGPIAELEATLNEWRGRLQTAQKELAAARLALSNAKRELGAQSRKKDLEIVSLERAIAQTYLDMGKILQENRAVHSSLDELYGRIDEIKLGMKLREELIARLEMEREYYDHAATKQGKTLLLAVAGLVLAAIITLIIVF